MCSRLPPPGLSTSPPMSPSRWHARGLVQDDSYRGVPKGRALPNIGHYFPVPGRRVALLPPVADVARSVLGGKDHGTTGPCEFSHGPVVPWSLPPRTLRATSATGGNRATRRPGTG